MPAGVSAFTPLANITLGSSASTVSFTSISGSYRDLYMVINVLPVSNGGSLYYRFNGDSATNYPVIFMYGNGTGAGASQGTNAQISIPGWLYFNTAARVNSISQIMDYSATDKHKIVLMRNDMAESNGAAEAHTARWANNSAITSIVLTAGASFAAGSSFALYGVSA